MIARSNLSSGNGEKLSGVQKDESEAQRTPFASLLNNETLFDMGVKNMAAKQEIEFIIKPDGNVEFTIKGVKGSQCVPISELFKVLGKTEADRPTAEFYEKEEEQSVTISGKAR